MDSLSKKLASNDKNLEAINIRMKHFSNATNDQGKIPGQPGELDTTNLVDIFNVGSY